MAIHGKRRVTATLNRLWNFEPKYGVSQANIWEKNISGRGSWRMDAQSLAAGVQPSEAWKDKVRTRDWRYGHQVTGAKSSKFLWALRELWRVFLQMRWESKGRDYDSVAIWSHSCIKRITPAALFQGIRHCQGWNRESLKYNCNNLCKKWWWLSPGNCSQGSSKDWTLNEDMLEVKPSATIEMECWKKLRELREWVGFQPRREHWGGRFWSCEISSSVFEHVDLDMLLDSGKKMWGRCWIGESTLLSNTQDVFSIKS